jgi:hypothetical protein
MITIDGQRSVGQRRGITSVEMAMALGVLLVIAGVVYAMAEFSVSRLHHYIISMLGSPYI